VAKNVSNNPWVFDAADQYEGAANTGETVKPVFSNRPYVKYILFESGAAGGNYDVRASNGGDVVSGIINLGANAQFELNVESTLDGVYIESFGSDGQILVFHGQEA